MSLMPEGVKVYFGESLKKRVKMEEILKNLFEDNQYNYIELPIYEYYKDIEESFSDSMKKKMFKMVDRDTGELIALRPDMTSILAKLIKLRKDEIKFPERIYYIGKVFRYEKIKSGTYREIKQAGIEFIGEERIKSDIEVLVIAIESMKKLGFVNPVIEIGDVRIFDAIFEKMALAKEEEMIIREMINRKDIPELTKVVANNPYKDILLKLPLIIGGKEIFGEVEKIYNELGIQNEINEIKEVIEGLEARGYKENYILDMGILKDMGYYTGIVFNGLTREFGDYILSGGRYDKLMGLNALGFALNVDAAVEFGKI